MPQSAPFFSATSSSRASSSSTSTGSGGRPGTSGSRGSPPGSMGGGSLGAGMVMLWCYPEERGSNLDRVSNPSVRLRSEWSVFLGTSGASAKHR